MDAGRTAAPLVRVRLLGPLEVTIGDRSIALGGPRQRAVLALLALQPGRAVQPGRLIAALWDDPPPAAANTIQVYVSRLRRALRPEGGTSPLLGVNGSYLLGLPADAVDVLRFETLAARGHAHLAAGDPAAAADTLRGALALWQGAPLPDLADLVEGQGVIARLESLRASALADRIDADAALGRHGALVPELAELVRRHPLDERLVGQFMVALYGAGRQADALAAYTAAAGRLDAELGLRPSPDLRSIYGDILRHDLPAPSRRDHAVVVPEDGPRLHDHGGSVGFFGRADERASVLALLGRPDVRLVTVLGPGGAGKTRLATELVATRRPAGTAVMVLLSALERVDDVLPEVCRALRAEPDWSGEPPLETAARALSAGPAVLVLDNLEQLAGVGDVVAALLDRVSVLKVLATTRVPLGLPGEQVVALGPLPVPAEGALGAAEVMRSDAVRLFRDRARLVLPDFEVTDENAPAVGELCRRLDGLPLALELAAARARMLSPAEILNRLDRRLELLAGGPAELPARHRSMWAAIDWSVRMLAGAELRVFAQLSVPAGGWTIEAAENICAAESFGGISGEEPVLDVLHRLQRCSLLVADGTGRMSMLDTIRDYAAELLAGAPERMRATRLRHAGYFTALAEDLGPRSQPWRADDGPHRMLEQEAANLSVALEFAQQETGSDDPVVAAAGRDQLGRIVSSLADHWYGVGRKATADRWVAVARQSQVPGEARVRLLLTLGNLALAGAEPAAALDLLAEAHAAAVELGEPSLVVRSLAAGGVASRYAGEPAAALARYSSARASAGDLGIVSLERALDIEIGEVLDDLGRTAEAEVLWEGVLAGAAADEDLVQQTYAQIDLAVSALERGEHDVAEAYAAEARAAMAANDLAPLLADVLTVSGLTELRLGHPAAAAGYLGRAVRTTVECGQLLALVDMVGLLGAARAQADVAVGARLLGAARHWRLQRGIRPSNRLIAAAVAAAETDLAGPGARRLELERARGARTPFGSLRGLAALDPDLLVPPAEGPTAVDLTERSAVIDLRAADRITLDDAS